VKNSRNTRFRKQSPRVMILWMNAPRMNAADENHEKNPLALFVI